MSADEWLALTSFLQSSAFGRAGAVITDLDGTAVHEHEGRPHISPSVEAGLAAVHGAGRQVVVDTLRFPLSVIRVFGQEWVRITGSPIPLVSMNGSQVGIVRPTPGGLEFDELDAFPLDAQEITEVLQGVQRLLDNAGQDLLVFFYPRDWRLGEQIWTPLAERVSDVRAKYRSASRVFSGSLASLSAELLARPICLVFLLVDAPADRLMAYQHTDRARFITHLGVDKRSGAIALAARLGISLPDSIGAGDAPPDNFLAAVGLAVIVGGADLGYRGLVDTLHVDEPATFGHMLLAIASALG